MFCGWEGNGRSQSVVALAMRHRLSGLSIYWLKGQCAGDDITNHQLLLDMRCTYAPLEYGHPLPFT